MYKKSKYNVIVDRLENGEILIYNTLNNAFGIMNVKTQEIYNNIEIFEEQEIRKIEEDDNFKDLIKYAPLYKLLINPFVLDTDVSRL